LTASRESWARIESAIEAVATDFASRAKGIADQAALHLRRQRLHDGHVPGPDRRGLRGCLEPGRRRRWRLHFEPGRRPAERDFRAVPPDRLRPL